MSQFDKGIHFLLCDINIFGKYAWIFPLKDKKGNTITTAFQKIVGKYNCKPNEIWVHKESKLYNTSMKPWTEKNDIKMYSGHDDQISVAAERFVRTLKNKIRKYMTSKSKKFILIN